MSYQVLARKWRPQDVRRAHGTGARRHRARATRSTTAGCITPTCSPARAASARPPSRASSPRASTASSGVSRHAVRRLRRVPRHRCRPLRRPARARRRVEHRHRQHARDPRQRALCRHGRALQGLPDRRSAHAVEGGLQLDAEDARGAARARQVRARDDRPAEDPGHGAVALPAVQPEAARRPSSSGAPRPHPRPRKASRTTQPQRRADRPRGAGLDARRPVAARPGDRLRRRRVEGSRSCARCSASSIASSCYRIVDALADGDGPALLAEADALAARGLSLARRARRARLAVPSHRGRAGRARGRGGVRRRRARRARTPRASRPRAVQLAYQICDAGPRRSRARARRNDRLHDDAAAPARVRARACRRATGGCKRQRRTVAQRAHGARADGAAAEAAPRRPHCRAQSVARRTSTGDASANVASPRASPTSDVRRGAARRAGASPRHAASMRAERRARPASRTSRRCGPPTRRAAAPRPGRCRPLPPDDWPAFVAGLKLTGMAAQLAAQTELARCAGNALTLALPASHKHLADKAYADKLKAALEQAIGPQAAARLRGRRRRPMLARRAGAARARRGEGERRAGVSRRAVRARPARALRRPREARHGRAAARATRDATVITQEPAP